MVRIHPVAPNYESETTTEAATRECTGWMRLSTSGKEPGARDRSPVHQRTLLQINWRSQFVTSKFEVTNCDFKILPWWLSGDSTGFVNPHTNTGSSSLPRGSKFFRWEIVQRQDARLWTSLYRFESYSPSQFLSDGVSSNSNGRTPGFDPVNSGSNPDAPAKFYIALSSNSNGRTAVSETVNDGSSPSEAAKFILRFLFPHVSV